MKREDIFNLLVPAFQDALNYLNLCISENKYISHAYEYVKITYSDNELPYFGEANQSDAPLSYTSVFDIEFNKIIPKSWTDFYNFIMNDDLLSKYWEIRDEDIDDKLPLRHPLIMKTHREIIIYGVIKSLLSRYIYEFNLFEFDFNKLKIIYIEWENAVFNSVLDIDLIIPILCVKFNFDNLKLNEFVEIRKMDEKIQKARIQDLTFYTTSINKTVVGAATHALVLKNWTLKNNDYESRNNSLYELNTFYKALPYIDNFFAALRIIKGIDTGYAQIVIKPQNWFDATTNDLPQINRVATRSYPSTLENYGWLRKDITVSISESKLISDIYNSIETIPDVNLRLAVKRLNLSLLRQEEEDTILDITIGLEALLVLDSNNEITYKLATRLAALTKVNKFNEYTASEVFKIVKNIYSYRSAIVHGSSKVDKKKELIIYADKKIPTIQLALELFRYVLKTLISYPQYLVPSNLDALLLE